MRKIEGILKSPGYFFSTYRSYFISTRLKPKVSDEVECLPLEYIRFKGILLVMGVPVRGKVFYFSRVSRLFYIYLLTSFIHGKNLSV